MPGAHDDMAISPDRSAAEFAVTAHTKQYKIWKQILHTLN